MSNRIKLRQSERGYRYSLDPFLLARFVQLKGSERVVDLGTGNGIIAILLTARCQEIRVTGIELQEGLAAMAAENVRQNGLDERVSILHGDIKEVRSLLPAESFEVAVGNPPFRRAETGHINPSEEKAVARHEIKLSLNDFVSACAYLITNRGRLNIIYHPGRLAEVFEVFRQYRIAPRRMRSIHSSRDSQANMVMLEGVKNGRNPLTIEKPLIIYKEGKEYTEEVKRAFPE